MALTITVHYPWELEPSQASQVQPIIRQENEIVARDYQEAAINACLKDLETHQSSILVLATGLGKTVIFSKIIQRRKGRILVLVDMEELLQQAYAEISSITGEVVGIERAHERELGERVVVATIQTISLKLDRFHPDTFSTIIVDEAHVSATESYYRTFAHFRHKRIGLTATDYRADGKPLPYDVCSYRMGIKEGIEAGYLVPVRGKRIVIDSIDLTKVKQTSSGDFDESALDDEMVKGASAIADIITNDYAFSKGILFFPSCSSAKLTNELINKRIPDLSVYIDGKIVGKERRALVNRLRDGKANWLCNVGVASKGWNWPEASVIGMCSPTLSRAAYVQRAGRGTRPLAGSLNGLATSTQRHQAIANGSKPYMTILDFVGISANLNLISAESFLEPVSNEPQEPKERKARAEADDERQDSNPEESKEDRVRVDLGIRKIVSGTKSTTVHTSEEFDPFEATGIREEAVQLKSTLISNDLLSEKQYNLLRKFGICDDSQLKKVEAQKIVSFIASKGFRLSHADKDVARKIYRDVKSSSG